MNIKEWEILNQRYLSEITNISLGMIKKSLKKLKIEGFIDNIINWKKHYLNLININKKAIILIADFGMCMAPINKAP